MMKKQMVVLLWIGLGFFAHAAHSITQDEALELARQEQILVSRLLKDIVMVGSNFLHKDAAQKDAKETADLFMNNLKKLKTVDSSHNWQTMMRLIEQHGEESRAFTELHPDRKDGMRYLQVFGTMDHLWSAPIDYLAKKTGSRPDNPVGVLLLYRTYVYQMPSLYLLRTWDLKKPDKVDQAMDLIRQQFHKNFWILQASHKTTDATRKLLKKLQGILLYFEVMWGSDVYTPSVIMKKSKEAQAIIGQLMQMYAK